MQCVVFDMDGVLFDSEALVLRSWEQTAEIHGIPDVREVCLRCLGTNAAESRRLFLEKYGADFPYDTYKAEMSARYWENVGEGKLELKPGVREILDALRQNGWKTAIASSTRTAVVREEMQHFGLEQMFDEIIGGDMVRRSKPDPEIYLTACRVLGAGGNARAGLRPDRRGEGRAGRGHRRIEGRARPRRHAHRGASAPAGRRTEARGVQLLCAAAVRQRGDFDPVSVLQ